MFFLLRLRGYWLKYLHKNIDLPKNKYYNNNSKSRRSIYLIKYFSKSFVFLSIRFQKQINLREYSIFTIIFLPSFEIVDTENNVMKKKNVSKGINCKNGVPTLAIHFFFYFI